MRNIILLIVSLFLINCQQIPEQETPKPKQVKNTEAKEIVTGRVINVKDGDSFTLVDSENKFHEIRLAHVDCPEKKQAFGRKAQLYTFNFTWGKQVTAYVESKDRYHRKICQILVDGNNLNEGIMKAGYAWHFKKYSKSSLFNSLELLARDQKVGLWADAQAKAPWEFRKRKPAKK